jgi:hypothetical protein
VLAAAPLANLLVAVRRAHNVGARSELALHERAIRIGGVVAIAREARAHQLKEARVGELRKALEHVRGAGSVRRTVVVGQIAHVECAARVVERLGRAQRRGRRRERCARRSRRVRRRRIRVGAPAAEERAAGFDAQLERRRVDHAAHLDRSHVARSAIAIDARTLLLVLRARLSRSMGATGLAVGCSVAADVVVESAACARIAQLVGGARVEIAIGASPIARLAAKAKRRLRGCTVLVVHRRSRARTLLDRAEACLAQKKMSAIFCARETNNFFPWPLALGRSVARAFPLRNRPRRRRVCARRRHWQHTQYVVLKHATRRRGVLVTCANNSVRDAGVRRIEVLSCARVCRHCVVCARGRRYRAHTSHGRRGGASVQKFA